MTRAPPIHQRRRKSNVATSYYAAAVAALVLVATTVLGAVEARSSEHHEQWALLAAGNRDYSNYRFQSDVAHAYQRIISGGVPEEHIVSLSYDDVPGSERNPYPGTLFNEATGQKPGVDVNKNFTKSYTGATVTVETFVQALTCSGEDESTPCVAAKTQDATLMVFWSGHGDAGLLYLPDMNASTSLYADKLVGALHDAKSGARSRGRSQGFARIVMFVEACDSGSMFAGLQLPDGVYVLTAAEPGQNSYPIYCCSFFRPPSCTIAGRDISSCLGDIFATSVWEAADDRANSGFSLDEMFEHARTITDPNGNPTGTGSRVTRYGDKSMGSQLFTDFVGALDLATEGNYRADAKTSKPAASSMVTLGSDEDGSLVQRSFEAALERRLHDVLDSIPTGGAVEPALFDCYRRLNLKLDTACSYRVATADPLRLPARSSQYALMLRACRADAEYFAGTVIDDVCRG